MLMKTFVLSLILSISTLTCNATSNIWNAQTNPLGSGDGAMTGAIQFVSATEGWINATGGKLLHTTNAGSNWTVVTPYPNDTLSSISDPAFNMQFLNASTGWVMKTFGNLSLNSNGNLQYYPAKGAVVYYTTNGGSSWNKSIVALGSGVVGAQLQFVDASNGFASAFNVNTGTGMLFKTTNGGANWTQVGSNMQASDEVMLFSFVSATTGYFLTINDKPAKFNISKTIDGGLNWVPQYKDSVSHGVDTMTNCGNIKFIDANNGWAIGPNSRMVRTINGGASWTPVTSSYTNNLNAYQKSLFMYDATHVWVSADLPNAYGSPVSHIVMHTADGGSTWTKDANAFDYSVFSIFFYDLNNGWLTKDYGGIYAYANGQSGINSIATNRITVNSGYGKILLSGCSPGNKIQLYHISGRQIRNLTAESSTITISDISSGFYLLKTEDSVLKIIVP